MKRIFVQIANIHLRKNWDSPADPPQYKFDQFNGPLITGLLSYFFRLPEDPSLDPKYRNLHYHKGIYIYGNVGTGKTMILDIIRDMLKHTDSYESFRKVKSKRIAKIYLKDGPNSLDQYMKREELLIDDIGSEDPVIWFGNRMDPVGSVLDDRYDLFHSGIRTHSTTNVSSDQLRDFYGARILSRLYEMCHVLPLMGTDKRITKTDK